MPISAYNFVCFHDILSNKLDDKYLVDVIGGVTEVSKLEITERNGKMNKRLEIELEDLEQNRLNCTLWGEFADIMTTYLSTHHGNPIIIIIQFAKIKTWKGVRCLSSSLFATKLLINENIGDIEDFKKREEKLWCDKCNAYVDDVNARFKLQIRVVDETGNASFVLFDREVAQIIGKSADQLRESCHSKIDDEDSIPDELNKIVDKKYLFKIKISEYNLQHDQEEVGESSKFGEFSLFAKEKYMVEQRKNDDDDNSEICSNSFSTPNHKRVFQDLQDTNIEEDITPAELSTSKSRKVIVVKKEKDETEF
ncbi:Replication protein A 70 kDa DNA-binding subunit C [Bienertia sinuspersici]